jgi:hypothetical protein
MPQDECVSYTVVRTDGAPLPSKGIFLVLRLDAEWNDLERFVARIFADLTQNNGVRRDVFAALEEITGRPMVGLVAPDVIYAGGNDAGLATGDTA